MPCIAARARAASTHSSTGRSAACSSRSSACTSGSAGSGASTSRQSGPLLLAANHRSFLDPFVLGTMVKRPVYYVAKKELFANRLQGWFLNALGAFPVDRGASDQEMLDDRARDPRPRRRRPDLPRGHARAPRRPRHAEARHRPPRARVRRARRPARRARHRARPPRLAHPPAPRHRPRRPPAHLPAASRARAGTSPRRSPTASGPASRCSGSGSAASRRCAAPPSSAPAPGARASPSRSPRRPRRPARHPHARARRAHPPGGENPYLPGVALDGINVVRAATPTSPTPTSCCSPSRAARCRTRSPPTASASRASAGLVVLSKGLVPPLGSLPTAFAAERVPARAIACLGGPAHALDCLHAARRSSPPAPTARSPRSSCRVLSAAGLDARTTDVTGVELAGIAKNAAALAAAAAAPAGPNAAGAAAGKVFAELQAYATRLGARPETFAGLAGTGDLVATVVAAGSRNRRAGELLGGGMPRRRDRPDARPDGRGARHAAAARRPPRARERRRAAATAASPSWSPARRPPSEWLDTLTTRRARAVA